VSVRVSSTRLASKKKNAPERDDGADGRKDLLGVNAVSSGPAEQCIAGAEAQTHLDELLLSQVEREVADYSSGSDDSRSRQPTDHSIGEQATSMQTHQRLPWTASAAARTLALLRSSLLCSRVEREKEPQAPSIPQI
jgi:hypothetical protein